MNEDYFISYEPIPPLYELEKLENSLFSKTKSFFDNIFFEDLSFKDDGYNSTFNSGTDILIDNYLLPPTQNQQLHLNLNLNLNVFNNLLPSFLNFLNVFNFSPNNQSINNHNTTSDGTFNNKYDFINALNTTYRQVLSEKGLDPNYSYVLTASAAMESGWGKKISGTFNYGGVKAGKNASGSIKSTIDYVNGLYIRRNLKFRNFSSIKDYCNYVVNLLSGEKYYHNAFSKFGADRPLEFWRYVLDSGYGGGDSSHKAKYVNDVGKIIETIKKNVSNVPMKPNYNVLGQPIKYNSQERIDYNNPLIRIDIEDLLKSEGITSVNGKSIKFGRRGLRPRGVSYGSKRSWHYVLDKYTGSASARDISIINGTNEDYAEFRRMLLNNKKVRDWMSAKGWGIINELTPAILKRTRGTGRHFHFGPDRWAKRTWNAWLQNPSIPVTYAI